MFDILIHRKETLDAEEQARRERLAQEKEIELNVNVFAYSLIRPSVHQTLQFTTLVLKSLIYCLISFGENSALAHFAAAIANHYNLTVSFH